MKLLDLLPQRVRMEKENFEVAATDIKDSHIQYNAFKQWVTRNKEKVVSLRKHKTDHTDSNGKSEQNYGKTKDTSLQKWYRYKRWRI